MSNELNEIKPVKNVYKGGFFKNRHRLSWRAPIVTAALVETFNLDPAYHTIIDVGCAIGDYVKELGDMGFLSCGIEGSIAAKEFFVTPNVSIWDLRQPIEKFIPEGIRGTKVDLVFSLEVAEHIEAFYSGVYLDNLCYFSDTILMTAAQPGQKGHGHVNCQPKEYWVEKMKRRGYQRQKNIEDEFAGMLKSKTNRREVLVYANNVLVFTKVGEV